LHHCYRQDCSDRNTAHARTARGALIDFLSNLGDILFDVIQTVSHFRDERLRVVTERLDLCRWLFGLVINNSVGSRLQLQYELAENSKRKDVKQSTSKSRIAPNLPDRAQDLILIVEDGVHFVSADRVGEAAWGRGGVTRGRRCRHPTARLRNQAHGSLLPSDHLVQFVVQLSDHLENLVLALENLAQLALTVGLEPVVHIWLFLKQGKIESRFVASSELVPRRGVLSCTRPSAAPASSGSLGTPASASAAPLPALEQTVNT
jgi:hypothetical protein